MKVNIYRARASLANRQRQLTVCVIASGFGGVLAWLCVFVCTSVNYWLRQRRCGCVSLGLMTSAL